MADLLLFLDDSGTRNPDKSDGRPAGSDHPDWFALGGVLLKSEDEAQCRAAHAGFCARWGIAYPLHSSDIRFRKNQFDWLGRLSVAEFDRFHSDLQDVLVSLPMHGIACVIDRPGYNARYLEKYGRSRWSLCKTAFSVVVERAAKLAIRDGRGLRVMPERADRKSDQWLRQYFDGLRRDGMPFDGTNSHKYGPLAGPDLQSTLREFRLKYKSSPMVQFADLYLYPLCRGGYADYAPHRILQQHGKVIDCVLGDGEVASLGVKYSCFDLVSR